MLSRRCARRETALARLYPQADGGPRVAVQRHPGVHHAELARDLHLLQPPSELAAPLRAELVRLLRHEERRQRREVIRGA